jgi:cytochrome c oxidase cbb3-type subunit III
MTDINRDALTGKATTGHEWDGIQELNTPLPKWWLYTLYACIVWAIGYWVLFPAWPLLNSYTAGILGYNSHALYHQEAATAAEAQRQWTDQIAASSVEAVAENGELLSFAMAGGRAVFNENCAACHAFGGAGLPNYPILADDEWIWGGRLSDIELTIRHGIRAADDPRTRNNVMPRFGADGLLTPDQINDVANLVVLLSGGEADTAAAERGKIVFTDNCAACHGPDAKGKPDLGSPNLTDDIWLYGGGMKAILAQIHSPKQGVMPAWQGRLSDAQIKMLAVYVHSLSGGQ